MTQVDVRQAVLAANAAAAGKLRDSFTAAGTLVVNLISSPGSGKTALLEATARDLLSRWKMGALDETSRPSATLSGCAGRAFRRGRS